MNSMSKNKLNVLLWCYICYFWFGFIKCSVKCTHRIRVTFKRNASTSSKKIRYSHKIGIGHQDLQCKCDVCTLSFAESLQIIYRCFLLKCEALLGSLIPADQMCERSHYLQEEFVRAREVGGLVHCGKRSLSKNTVHSQRFSSWGRHTGTFSQALCEEICVALRSDWTENPVVQKV